MATLTHQSFYLVIRIDNESKHQTATVQSLSQTLQACFQYCYLHDGLNAVFSLCNIMLWDEMDLPNQLYLTSCRGVVK